VCAMTRVCHDSCVPWLMRAMTHACHDSCVPWLSTIHMTWLLALCAMTHPHMWHASFTHVTWLTRQFAQYDGVALPRRTWGMTHMSKETYIRQKRYDTYVDLNIGLICPTQASFAVYRLLLTYVSYQMPHLRYDTFVKRSLYSAKEACVGQMKPTYKSIQSKRDMLYKNTKNLDTHTHTHKHSHTQIQT